MGLREVTLISVIVRIFAAALIGGLLGMERELKNRAAGLRTYMLVCVGACLVMLTNQYIYQAVDSGDPVRMGAQVVSGIGFLGAGTIIVTRRSQIKGLTTAAGLWSAAGVGLALGIGFYEAAIFGGLAIFMVMSLLQRMDDRMHTKAKRIDIYFEITEEVGLGGFLREIREQELEASNLLKESSIHTQAGVSAYCATLKTKKRRNHLEILEDLQKISGIVYLEEL